MHLTYPRGGVVRHRDQTDPARAGARPGPAVLGCHASRPRQLRGLRSSLYTEDVSTGVVTTSRLLLAIACVIALTQPGCTRGASTTPVSSRSVGHATLGLIPADTPYAWVTLDPVSPALRERMWSMQDEDLVKALRRGDDGSDTTLARLARAILGELVDGTRVRALSELGFAANGRFAFYGLSVWPVVRLEVKEGAKLRAAAGRVFTAVGPQIRRQQRDGYTYWVAELDQFSVVIAVLDSEAVLALVPSSSIARTLPLLFGTERPAASLASTAKLEDIARRYELTRELIGFIDMRTIVAIMTGRGQGPNYDLGQLVRDKLGPIVIPCRADLERIAAFAPSAVLGYRRLDERGFEGAIYVETPAAFNQAIGKMRTAVPAIPAARDRSPLLAVTAGVKVDALLGWLGDALGGLVRQPFTCPGLQGVQTFSGQLAASIATSVPPMLRGLRGVSLVLDDATISPPGGTGHVIVVGDQVPALVSFLLQLPVFAGAPPPALGIPVELPIQQLGLPGLTSAHLAHGSDRLAVAVGTNSDDRVARAMAARSLARSPLLSISYDVVRFRELLPSDDPQRFGNADQITFDIDVTERGLEIGFVGRWTLPPAARAR